MEKRLQAKLERLLTYVERTMGICGGSGSNQRRLLQEQLERRR